MPKGYPRNPEKAKKRGGRRRGSKNQRTVIREALVAEAAREVGIKPETAPLKRLIDLGKWFEGRAAQEQRKARPDESMIFRCLQQAGQFYAQAAPYCHPRLSAIMVKQDDTPRDETIQVTLKIGDKVERITHDNDGNTTTTIDYEDADAEDIALEAALSTKN